MIESIGVGLKEQIQTEQKLAGKNSQLISDIKVGDILKGSLTKLGNGQIVLLSEGNEIIPVKLQGMAIFNESIILEVIQKKEGQILLKLLQSEVFSHETLQNKIMNELDLPKTDPMRQLIETFLAKQMPLQRESLLKNYHIHQSFQIPTEVLANLCDEIGEISLQEAKSFYEIKQGSIEQLFAHIGDIVGEVQDSKLTNNILVSLEKYLGKNMIEDVLKEFVKTNELTSFSNMQKLEEAEDNTKYLNQERSNQFLWEDLTTIEKETSFKATYNIVEELLSKLPSEGWGQLGKITKSLLLKTLIIDTNKLQYIPDESKCIENMNKVLKEILKTLEDAHLPEKYTQTLKQLEETVQVINKFNVQGEYYFFPLNLPQGEGKGELYFFKPKKKTNGGREYLYVVLALDLPRLKNIEIHMRKENKNILLHFKVKEKSMLQLIEAHKKNLIQIMGQTAFHLDEVRISLLEEKEVGTFLRPVENMVNHMDFKI